MSLTADMERVIREAFVSDDEDRDGHGETLNVVDALLYIGDSLQAIAAAIGKQGKT